MSVDEVVEIIVIPESMGKFAFWNPVYQGKVNYKFESCASFCTGGACTTALMDQGYLGEKTDVYKKN
jgi:hypothetical protein